MGSVCRPVPLFVFCTSWLGRFPGASRLPLDSQSSPPSQKLPSTTSGRGMCLHRAGSCRSPTPPPPQITISTSPCTFTSPLRPAARVQTGTRYGGASRPGRPPKTGALCARFASSCCQLIAAFRDSCSRSQVALMRAVALCGALARRNAQ